MAWECLCGVSNRDSRVKCRACRAPQGMVWSPHGFVTPAEARLLAKTTEYKTPPADFLGWLIRTVWLAGVFIGASAGFYLARLRSFHGLRAMKAVLNPWKNLPWTFWSRVTTSLGTEAMIGAGVILALLFLLLPGQTRQNTITLFGHLIFVGIIASLLGTVTYFVGIFVYDLGPYFRFRW